jgi:hypothetical protein
MVLFIENVHNKKIHKDRKQTGGYQGLREGGGLGSNCLMGTGFSLGEMKCLEQDRSVGCTVQMH